MFVERFALVCMAGDAGIVADVLDIRVDVPEGALVSQARIWGNRERAVRTSPQPVIYPPTPGTNDEQNKECVENTSARARLRSWGSGGR
jgi:hypothetical protein